MKKIRLSLSILGLGLAFIGFALITHGQVTKPSGNPPACWESPAPTTVQDYLNCICAVWQDWCAWLTAHPSDIPSSYSGSVNSTSSKPSGNPPACWYGPAPTTAQDYLNCICTVWQDWCAWFTAHPEDIPSSYSGSINSTSSCTLSVTGSPARYCDGHLTWVATSAPSTGYKIKWYGTKNGVQDENGSDYSQTTNLNWTDGPWATSSVVGNYTRYFKAFDSQGNQVCTSNSLNLSITGCAASTSSITFSITPQSSQASPLMVGNQATGIFQFTPWSYFQGYNWTIKSKVTDTSTGSVVNDTDFIAGWNDIVAQNLCNSTGYCTMGGVLQVSQLQCNTSVNNIRKREEWVVSNGVESNHSTYYFKCSNATSSVSGSLIVSLSEFNDVFIVATRNYLLGTGPKLTQAELKDLSTARLSASGGSVNLSGTGVASGEKLIDIYNKAKGVVSNTSNPPTSLISLSRTPSTSISSPFKAGDSTTATFQFTPWSSFQGKDWTLKSKTIDTVTGATTNDTDFIAAWSDISAQNLCNSNGNCSMTGTWQTSQFQCSTNVNNIRKREEWVVSNGVESNHSVFYFECSNANTTSTPSSCHALSFRGGSINPSSVSPSGSYTISCDYGENVDCIFPTISSGSCKFTNFTGTSANFSCTAGSSLGTFSGICATFNNTATNCCSRADSIGNLTVNVSTPAQGLNAVNSALQSVAKPQIVSKPVVNLFVNNSHNPSPVTAPANLIITWAIPAVYDSFGSLTSPVSICFGHGPGWNGSVSINGGSASGLNLNGNLNNLPAGTYTYSISCNLKTGGTISDSVTINIVSASSSSTSPVASPMVTQSKKSEALALLRTSVTSQPAFQKSTTQNFHLDFASNIAVSLDFIQRLTQASKGLSVAPNTSVSPEVKVTLISKNQWLDKANGISIISGLMSVGSVGWPAVSETQTTQTGYTISKVTIAEAISPDGKTAKVSITDELGVLNVTLTYNSDGSFFIKTTGWLNLQGTIGADSFQSIYNAIQNLAYQRHVMLQNMVATVEVQNASVLLYNAALFSGMTADALKNNILKTQGDLSEDEVDALIESALANYKGIHDAYEKSGSSPASGELPSEPEYLGCETVVVGSSPGYCEEDPDTGESYCVEPEETIVSGGECDVLTSRIDIAPSDLSSWFDFNSALETEGIKPIDTLVPADFDTSLAKGADTKLLPNSSTYFDASGFPQSYAQALEYFASVARDVFSATWQDTVNSIPVFIFNDKGYKDVSEATVLSLVERGQIDWDEKDAVIEEYNQLAGFNTANNIIIVNGDFSTTVYTGVTGVLVHEYAHGIDRNPFTGAWRFSDSPEWREIYKAAELTGPSAFVGKPDSLLDYDREYAAKSRQEDFAMAVEYYYFTGGNPSKITSDPFGLQLIQRRFDFLKKNGIVK